ncbi:MAG: DUF2071 domain-containing protein [Acidobacteria bacterium]|nr:DUF2071 domain-containing protein [Acidobacteriota bacterium]
MKRSMTPLTTEPHLEDRIEIRRRPDGWPIMYQSWGSLLFIHWLYNAEELADLIPKGLSIDTFEGNAYVGITPFTLWNVRPILTPPLPWLSEFNELNVRTYVHLDGEPGVYFFSLDANRILPVLAARNFFHLPYKAAEIELIREGRWVDYRAERTEKPRAAFAARWMEDPEIFHAVPNSLEFFLTERYALFTEHEGELYSCRIHHEAWPLRRAVLEYLDTTLFEADRIPRPTGDPFVIAGGPVHVEVWPLEKGKP